MLGKAPFSFDLLRKYVAAFGSLMNEIEIVRADTDGDPEQVLKVPVSYAHKDKLLARVFADPNIDRPSAAPTLPRISFEMTNFRYDSSRMISPIRRFSVKENRETGVYKEQLTPVPYKIDFTLWVFAKYQADGNKIVEQILPFFTPSFTPSLDLIPGMEPPIDCPVTLKDVHCEDSYDGKYEQRRAIIWTLTFEMDVLFWGPIRQHPIIRFANVNLYNATKFTDITDAVGNTTAIDYVRVKPGLTANGQPTSNAALSIPTLEINVTDDFGYCIEIGGNTDPSEGTGGE
jgi:hypothetical protein